MNNSLLFYCIMQSFLLVLSHATLKVAVDKFDISSKNFEDINLSLVILSILMFGASFLGYMILLSKNEIGWLFAFITALTLVGLYVIGIFFFKDDYNPESLVGLCLVIIGSILLTK